MAPFVLKFKVLAATSITLNIATWPLIAFTSPSPLSAGQQVVFSLLPAIRSVLYSLSLLYASGRAAKRSGTDTDSLTRTWKVCTKVCVSFDARRPGLTPSPAPPGGLSPRAGYANNCIPRVLTWAPNNSIHRAATREPILAMLVPPLSHGRGRQHQEQARVQAHDKVHGREAR